MRRFACFFCFEMLPESDVVNLVTNLFLYFAFLQEAITTNANLSLTMTHFKYEGNQSKRLSNEQC